MHTHTHTHAAVNSCISVQLSEPLEEREREWERDLFGDFGVLFSHVHSFTSQMRLLLQKSWKLKDDRCTNARPSSHLENFNHVSMARCVQCSSVTISKRLEACVSERADFGSTWKIWVCQVAVSFFRRPTALSKFGMGISAARRVPSTVPLTSCRNAGGNWIVFLCFSCVFYQWNDASVWLANIFWTV